uniref:Uncharacterized protein n=1 Tax=Sphaerodactylus townsendi TaxID=933632 RepID=A0ACB8EB76_9SAUR
MPSLGPEDCADPCTATTEAGQAGRRLPRPLCLRMRAEDCAGRCPTGRGVTLRLRCRFLPQQLVYWAQVDWEAPRYRSTTIIANLLGIMKELPSISILEEDVLGHVVVQLAVSLADPEEGIQQKAREVMSQLLTMLLHRRRGE